MPDITELSETKRALLERYLRGDFPTAGADVGTIPTMDLRHMPREEREAEALRLATEDARGLFDLERGPLLRSILTRLDDEEHRWFLTLHHIIFDGVAIYQVFLPELRAIYEAFL